MTRNPVPALLAAPFRRPVLTFVLVLGFLFSALVNAIAVVLVVGALQPGLPSEAVGVMRAFIEDREHHSETSPLIPVRPELPPPPDPAELRSVALIQ